MRCEPPPVKRHTGGRPLKSAAFFSPEISCLSSEPQGRRDKNGKRPVRKAGACIFHAWLMSDLPWLHVLCSPLGDHSSCRHTHGARGEARYLCRVARFSGKKRRPGPLHNQLVPLCPKYLICINFIAAALSYLY